MYSQPQLRTYVEVLTTILPSPKIQSITILGYWYDHKLVASPFDHILLHIENKFNIFRGSLCHPVAYSGLSGTLYSLFALDCSLCCFTSNCKSLSFQLNYSVKRVWRMMIWKYKFWKYSNASPFDIIPKFKLTIEITLSLYLYIYCFHKFRDDVAFYDHKK